MSAKFELAPVCPYCDRSDKTNLGGKEGKDWFCFHCNVGGDVWGSKKLLGVEQIGLRQVA